MVIFFIEVQAINKSKQNELHFSIRTIFVKNIYQKYFVYILKIKTIAKSNIDFPLNLKVFKSLNETF